MWPVARSDCRCAALAAFVVLSSAASAQINTYSTVLTTLNNRTQVDAGNGSVGLPDEFAGSEATGTAALTVDLDAFTMRVQINATGLEAGVPHVARIHGRIEVEPGGTPLIRDSFTPTLAQDADGDGFIEFGEGQASYGPVLFDLGPITTASATSYDRVFDLSDPSNFGLRDPSDPSFGRYGATELLGDNLMALHFRELVLYGLSVPSDVGAPPGEVDGSAGLKAQLPIAAGEIVQGIPVSEPAVPGLVGLGVLGVLALRPRRTRQID